MKKSLLLVATAVAFSVTAFAQTLGPKGRIFAKYDTNKNGVIDGDEVAAVRKAFAADPKGEFAVYDKDHDGKLSDEEIASIKPPGGKKAGEKKAGGKKADAPKPAEPDKKGDAK
jgi:hypothetical protein